MIDILNDALIKMIGSVDAAEEITINDIDWLKNKHRTIYKVNE